jgi:hypothetical protein
MASPQQPDDPHPDDHDDSFRPVPYDFNASGADYEKPRIIRLRIAPWDVICTVALLALLIVLATATSWPSKLYGFLGEVCSDETCGPVPYGVDFYI